MRSLLALLVLLSLFIVGCTQPLTVESDEPLVEETVEEETQDDSDDGFGLNVVVGDEEETDEVVEDVDEVEEEVVVSDKPFDVIQVRSFGYVYSGTYTHDHIYFSIRANEDLHVGDISLYSKVKQQEYVGAYDVELPCIARNLALASRRGGFSVTDNSSSALQAGEQATLCIPTTISMTRNEQFPLDVFYDGELIYRFDWMYPANIRSTTLDLNISHQLPLVEAEPEELEELEE